MVIKYCKTGPLLSQEVTSKDLPSSISGQRSVSQRFHPHTQWATQLTMLDTPTKSTDPEQIEHGRMANTESGEEDGGLQLRTKARPFEPEASGNINCAARACQEESTEEEKGGRLYMETRLFKLPAGSKYNATTTKTPGPVEILKEDKGRKLRVKARPFTPVDVSKTNATSQLTTSFKEESGTRLCEETLPCSTHFPVHQLVPPPVIPSRATARLNLAQPRAVQFAGTLITDTWTPPRTLRNMRRALYYFGAQYKRWRKKKRTCCKFISY